MVVRARGSINSARSEGLISGRRTSEEAAATGQGVKLVVHSSWRKQRDLEALRELLEPLGPRLREVTAPELDREESINREFYQGDIRPLRVPRANERLDPPLVDVFVKGGYRKGDVNDPEAKAIADEIESILADALFDGRSIGVVTLLGTSQAALIHEMVSDRISPIDVIARKIAIGPPPVFQGRERDIMLVSMVLDPGDRSAATRPPQSAAVHIASTASRLC